MQSKSPFVVTMAADADYALPTLVAICSILATKNADSDIQICLIASNETESVLRAPLECITEHYGARKIEFLPPPLEYDKASIQISHITVPTYYRLALPDLLPEVDECLYLDGDLVVLADLPSAFGSPMKEELLRGVKAAAYYYPSYERCLKARRLGIGAFDEYVNAGVLQMNLKLMRELDLTKTFEELLCENYSSQDQDILNSACYGRIETLGPAMNLMTKYHPENPNSFDCDPSIKLCWTKKEWNEACARPVIVHYAGAEKPWQDLSVDFADLWWRAAETAGAIVASLKATLPTLRKNAEAFTRSNAAFLKCDEDRLVREERLRLEEEKVKEQTAEIQRLEEEVKRYDNLAEELERLLVASENERETTQEELRKKTIKLREVRDRLKRAKSECRDLSLRINDLKASNSWKAGRALTAFPRAAKRAAIKFKNTSRGGASLEQISATQDILLYDVSIDTDNLGDEIIMKYSRNIIREIFPNSKIFPVPTHRAPSEDELAQVPPNATPYVFGTNIICPDVKSYNLWRMPSDPSLYSNTVFVAVGMNSYGEISEASRRLYHSIANKGVLHSARDKYSAEKMRLMGIGNVLYTGCITMWGMTPEACSCIPLSKGSSAVLTLTAHRASEHDQTLVDAVFDNYEKVYFWPQGDKDLSYLESLRYNEKKLETLPRTLAAFEEILNRGGVDYIGTRLHGGIHALNHGVRTIVIEVDNRATEIARDTGLPSLHITDVAKLSNMIRSEFEVKIDMPWDAIAQWKSQF